ncbi:unnamed protein product [Gongylonema pulchrum]|uniref:RNA helicase n=1 Tax=Gongylonema pulchrum TaxID=637853 RepID=A0A183E315_9BILA|nr:unnamed protein product [Gongylonema pulchrum]
MRRRKHPSESEIGASPENIEENMRKKKFGIEPTTFVESVESMPESGSEPTFRDFGLDEQILKVIGELGWERPTLVQSRMIPLAFEHKNILARARTGSGKTAAYMLPIVQRILQLKCSSDGSTGPFALFIVPSKELAKQVRIFCFVFIFDEILH